jgi:HTH-like domain
MGFIDTMRSRGHAVESVCRVLREQGCQVAARTYRSWKTTSRLVAARTVSDAHVIDAVRDIAWTTDAHGQRKLAPEGLYGRRKMTAYLRRTAQPDASAGSVDRAMRTLGLAGVRRDKGIRTTIPAKDGVRAGDLLNRTFTAEAPNRTWVTDFTYSAQPRVMCSSVGRPSLGMAIASGAAAHNHRSCRKARSRSPGLNRVGAGLGSPSFCRTASLAARSASRY